MSKGGTGPGSGSIYVPMYVEKKRRPRRYFKDIICSISRDTLHQKVFIFYSPAVLLSIPAGAEVHDGR